MIIGAGTVAVGFSVAMISVGWHGYTERSWAYWLATPVGLAFIAAGLTAWWRWPANRLGALMVAGGAAWYLTSLQDLGNPVLFALGFWLTYLSLVVITHAVLVYPEGRLTLRLDRWVLIADYAAYLVLQGIRYLVEGRHGAIGPRPAHGSRLGDLISLNAIVFAVIVGGLLVRRWLAASPPARRVHAPVWLTVIVGAVVLLLSVLASLLKLPGTLQSILILGYGLCLVALPFAFLSGLIRVRLARLRVADLVVQLERATDPVRLRDLLAWALGDPTLVVGFWSGQAAEYLDPAGRPVALTGRAVTRVDLDERPLAVLVHDSALADQPALIDAAAAALRLALARASAARAALDERRKIERNLHDGVQQRLLRLSWLAKQARMLAPADVALVLEELASEARDTFVELREVARGIHPSLVTERGLAEAVEEYALRAPVPVHVDLPLGRYPEPVEITAFFVVSEAVVNAVRHAGADEVTVSGRAYPGRLVVEVSDEGCGGADPRRGTGLRGLRERVAALGGTLTVRSVPGHGTRVRAELPCG
jgi:signal transduction histidine kinase